MDDYSSKNIETIQRQKMIVRVFGYIDKKYLDGYTYRSLVGDYNCIQGSPDQYYEVSNDDLDYLIDNYETRDPSTKLVIKECLLLNTDKIYNSRTR